MALAEEESLRVQQAQEGVSVVDYIIDGLEAELELERELGVRFVECDRSLLAPLTRAPRESAPGTATVPAPAQSAASPSAPPRPAFSAPPRSEEPARPNGGVFDFVFLHDRPLSAAVGSALADLLSGFAIYAPATFIIKGLDAAIAWLLWKTVKLVWKKQSLDALCRVISAVAAETVMVFGYFVFECALYSFAGGAAALLGNAMQGALCTVCAVLLISALCAVPSVKKLFPPLE